MSLYYHNSLVGQAENQFGVYQQYPAKGNSELGKEDFLRLLVAQLTHQDPLNPMEDKEFTAQLAQFSSLEQLTNISSGIETLSQGTARQEMLSAVSFIGKEVLAQGDTMSKVDGKVNTIAFTIDEAASNCYINVFDSNGNIVKTIQMNALQAGTYDVEWDGTDSNGQAVANGVYYVAMAAENGEGRPIMVQTQVSGVVKGVRAQGSTYFLQLEDGREVSLMNITKVVSPENNTQTGGTGGE